MLFWYVGLSVLFVALVFRSSGIDYRLVALGALLPTVVDAPIGHRSVGHTLVFAVALLVLVMLGTIGRPRLVRRRLICLPIGVLCGLVLAASFSDAHLFWWPFLGAFGQHGLLPAWWVVGLLELAGLFTCWVIVGRYDLYLRGPRAELVRTGRLRDRLDQG